MALRKAPLLVLALTLGSGRLVANDPARSDGSDIGLAIIGAIVQKDSDENVALIKDEKGVVSAVKKGHVIMDRFKVIAVFPDHIRVITRDAKIHWVYQDKFASGMVASKTGSGSGGNDVFKEEGFERTKNKIVMSGMYRDKLVKQDLAKVLMQASAEPHLENGSIVGFKISQIDEGSIYAKAGLTDGDVITSINGTDLTSVAGAMQLLQTLKGAEHVSVDVRRGGATVKISLDVN